MTCKLLSIFNAVKNNLENRPCCHLGGKGYAQLGLAKWRGSFILHPQVLYHMQKARCTIVMQHHNPCTSSLGLFEVLSPPLLRRRTQLEGTHDWSILSFVIILLSWTGLAPSSSSVPSGGAFQLVRSSGFSMRPVRG